MTLRVLIVMVCVLASAGRTEATSITLSPGPAGSTFVYQSFDFTALNNTPFDGQTRTLDVWFDQPLVATGFVLNLFLNESGPFGAYPIASFGVTGYLMDDEGDPVGSPLALPRLGQMPAQIWPGWPFERDGAPYLPATTLYETDIAGTREDPDPEHYLIHPLVFSGLHLQLNYPEGPASVIGGRLTLGTFSAPTPIYVAPNPTPVFRFTVPDASSTGGLLMVAGLLLIAWRHRVGV